MSYKKSSILDVPRSLRGNGRLIINLAKNDFKTRFAGSYLGVVWAFVQPVVTVFVYWFVFEKALNVAGRSTRAGIEVPYVLWMIAGLVPWFFFSEAVSFGTSCLLDYNYLVKKVVFNISTLPVVKVAASLFVHVFFIAFMIILYGIYGFYPNVYMLQIIYYSFATILLILGIIYITSAVVVFFKDLTQIINIVLQVLVWMTPIMWNMDGMNLSPTVRTLLMANPMYYIVDGYRDAMINNVWFWEKPGLTLYFWVVTLILLALGNFVFSKLKAMLADVL